MAQLKAVIFDQDGVLADTERDGHRVAFNAAFRDMGLDIEWDVETYRRLLLVGGGKERVRQDFMHRRLNESTEDFDGLVRRVHERKTEIFLGLLADGRMALRPGVARLVKECHAAGMKLAVCSTANEKVVRTLVRTLIGDGYFDAILAGDIVKAKKPDPGVYNLAKERFGLRAEECIVVEDSRNGLLAARGAGLKCIITVNDYTKDEDFSEAALVVSCLGDKTGVPARIIKGPPHIAIDGQVTLATLRETLAS